MLDKYKIILLIHNINCMYFMLKFVALFLSICFFANAKSSNNIVVVNFALLEEKAKVTQSLAAQIKTKQESLQKEVEAMQKSFQKKVDDLEKSNAVLTQKALEQKKMNLQKEIIQADENLKNRTTKLEQTKNDALMKLNEQIKNVIEDVAQKEGYDIVISETSVAFYKPEKDITNLVIQEVDKKIANIKIDWSK